MNVKLDAESQRFVSDQLARGAFRSASEIFREALLLLRHRQELRELKLEELRKDLAASEHQIRRGQYRTYTDKTLHLLTESIKREGRKRLAAEKKRNEARTARNGAGLRRP